MEQAKKLEPRYLSLVIPSRWFAGGKGLDEFREAMLTDNASARFVDYLSAATISQEWDSKAASVTSSGIGTHPGDCE